MSDYDDLIFSTPDAQAYWKGEELSPPGPAPNSDFIDSLSVYNGTLQPNAVAGLVQGLVGPILTDAVSFGLGGGIARVPSLGNNSGDIFITGAQTWEVWFQHFGDGAVHMLMNRGGDATNTYLSVNQPRNGALGGRLVASLDWGGVLRGLTSCEVSANEWHLAHLTYDGVDTMSLYLDTWLVSTRSDCPAAPLTDTNPWRHGYVANIVFGAVDRNDAWSHGVPYSRVLTLGEIVQRGIVALGSRPNNPCGETPVVTVGCPGSEGVVGEPYSSEILVSGGTPPYTFSVFSGALPDGLTLDPSTGVISGTPTVANPFDFVIQVIDSEFNVGFSSGCQIVISEVPPPSGPPVDTFSFDFGAGNRVAWWIAPQVTDSGDNLRDKTVKSFIATGRMTNPRFSVYAYSPESSIDASEIEAGTGSTTGKRNLPTTTQVKRYARRQINVPNAMMHTWRLEGITEEGDTTPDRVDEVVTEIASQGIRR